MEEQDEEKTTLKKVTKCLTANLNNWQNLQNPTRKSIDFVNSSLLTELHIYQLTQFPNKNNVVSGCTVGVCWCVVFFFK